ncbi:MAG TPA: hypothetical protein VLW85_01590 [Myxococcales bacterium]|nr:hypothetical protein [Myxococcales bacterium]
MLLLLAFLMAAPAQDADRLANARSLLAAGKYADALIDLQAVSLMYGNTLREQAELQALRATALLGLPDSPKHRQDAADAVIAVYHVDPDGAAMARASDAARQLAQQIRSTRLLVLTDRIVTARSGRPLRIRARLAGAHVGEPQLSLDYSAQRAGSDDTDFVRIPMDRTAAPDTYEAWLRPGVGGVPGGGEHLLLYYIEAEGPDGTLLDSNGSARDPIRLTLSDTLPEAAGIAALDEGGRPAHPVEPPPPVPWYRHYGIIGTVAGAIVVGSVVAIIAAQPKPQPQNGTLGKVDLP